jgi:hypothetical protein
VQALQVASGGVPLAALLRVARLLAVPADEVRRVWGLPKKEAGGGVQRLHHDEVALGAGEELDAGIAGLVPGGK